MRRVSVAVFALIFGLQSTAEEVTYAHRPLQKFEGYLLLDLLLERDVSEIALRPPLSRMTGFGKRSPKDLKLGPYKEGRHLALIPLKEGWYHWVGTAVPHFDLPFRMDTSDDERWRFSISKQRINYIGQLVVRKERSSDSVSVDLLTRIAATQDSLTTVFANELAQYPLRYGGYPRDRFFEAYYPDPKESLK